jgi:magnesium transporter
VTSQDADPPIEHLEHDGHMTIATLIGGILETWQDDDALAALGAGLVDRVRESAGTGWIDLAAPTAAQVARIGELLGLHPLIAEDILEGNQRPKLEVTGDVVHIVMFALDDADEVETHEIDLVLGPRFLLSAHPAAWDPHAGRHFKTNLGTILKSGPDHLLWAICDGIVDAYFPFADRMEDAIDELQDTVMARTDRETLARVFTLKREVISVRRAITPVREVLNQLTNRELALIDPAELLYFRDIYDHVIRLTDELDNDRELVTATLDVYLSQVNNNLSAIMKRLTGVTVIIAGIGAIAGIFGMSEAGLAFSGGEARGFWLVALATVVISAFAAWILHRLDWI